ncbi:hypothetical protein BCR44DRAFT_1426938 [Catenaria anguillulae PL171]|uniref:Uncharacterized protein n=1 Tax=Catenaria anguillulae PL171 TaxID=765915 RepID=A0A1Y2I097_9FUNG|nr:hypothetical protein BCR44DRAFT_1426938 [Catenaria anguillulae PL171]
MPLDPSPTKKSAKAQPKPTASTSSPNRPPPPGHSDDDESHWLPTKPAPSVSRTSLFDLTACASQPQNISRPEVVDLSDSDEDAEVRDVGMGSTKVSGTHGHHADAAKPTCELVDVIDSDDDSGSDDYSVRKLGRVLINGVGRGSSEPSPGTGAVEDDHDSERVSHGSFAPSFGLAAADLTISKMESTKPSSLAPRRFFSPIQLGDSDSDVEFVGETAATSSAASKPQPDAHSQSSSRPHINAPTPSTAVPPPSLQLAPISQPRKPKETSTPARTSHTRVLSPVAGSSSDDNEVVCMDPLPAKPTDVSGAHAIGGPVSSGPSHPGSRNPSRMSSPTTTRAYGDGNKLSASNRSLRRSRPTSPLASPSARTLQAELVNVSSDVEGLAGALASARKRKLDERVRDDNGVDRDVIVLDDSDDEQEASKRRKIG